MEFRPLISVVISCYNSGKIITECLNSVLNQTYTNIEILILDDGSTDDSFTHIEKFNINKNIFIFKKNQGLTKSLNFLISKSNGEWIARIDADDIWDPFKLEKQIKLLLKDHQSQLACCFHKLLIDNNEKK